MLDNSRSRTLAAIRISLGSSAPPDAIAAEYAAIPRRYTQSKDASYVEDSGLLIDRLLEYGAGCYRVKGDGISSMVSEVLTSRGKRNLAIPAGLPATWLPKGFSFELADDWTTDQLDRAEGTLSACTAAIAETGSIVLQNTAAQGPRRLSLVPDYFLCVVFASQIVATVPEAFARIAVTSTLPTTFISGPSATADIEMTRIKGVHGPRHLDVILVDD